MTADELKQFLEEWNLSVTQAGRLFGIMQPVLYRMLNGMRKNGVPGYTERSILFFLLIPEEKQKELIAEAKKTPIRSVLDTRKKTRTHAKADEFVNKTCGGGTRMIR